LIKSVEQFKHSLSIKMNFILYTLQQSNVDCWKNPVSFYCKRLPEGKLVMLNMTKKLWVHKGTPGQLTRPRNGSQWWIYCSRCVWYGKVIYIHGGLNVRYGYLKENFRIYVDVSLDFCETFSHVLPVFPIFFLQTCFQCSFFRYIFPYVSQNTFGVFPTLLCPIRK
jgi:hypothetical protein